MFWIEKSLFFIIILLSLFGVSGQSSGHINVIFDPVFQGVKINIDDQLDRSLDSTEVVVDLFRCYISNVQLLHNSGAVYLEEEG